MAVQVIAYEVRMARLATQESDAPAADHEETPYPLVDDLERFYGHWNKRCWQPALSVKAIRCR